MADDRASLAVRLPRDLVAKIDAEAAERMVSRTWLVERMLRESLPLLAPADEYLRPAPSDRGDERDG